jgi:3-dehydroquinate synthase
VLRDRKEENIRKYLNFGHTIGHAIESIKLNSNSKVFHGEAVIAGIIIELYLSYKVLNFPIDIVRKVKEHLENIFEKIYISSNEIKDLFKLLQFDKKNYLDKVNFVLLEDIGNCKVDINVENEIITEAIDFYNS